MNCPACNNDLSTPRYGHIPGRRRRTVYSRCPACDAVIDRLDKSRGHRRTSHGQRSAA